MSNLIPLTDGGGLQPRDARRYGRVMARGKVSTELAIASIDNETDKEMAKADSVTAATGTAMTAVARVAQAQNQLEQLAPQASTRLNMLADAHSMAMVDLMVDLNRKLRRL